MRARVYVDGFNLFYGALKGTEYKWLNLVELTRRLIPEEYTLERLRYFTARVSGQLNPGAPARQQIYLTALKTLPEVQVHVGRFLAKSIWRPLINLPVAGKQIDAHEPVSFKAGNYAVGGIRTLPVGIYPADSPVKKRPKRKRPMENAVIAEVHTMEEKGSDVNLAAHLLNDAWKGLFDMAIVISNDTDLVTPIRMVTIEREKPVMVVCPGRWEIAPQLKKVASHVRHICGAMLKAAQFPDNLPYTTVHRPREWY